MGKRVLHVVGSLPIFLFKGDRRLFLNCPMPNESRIHLMASDISCTYGMDVNLGLGIKTSFQSTNTLRNMLVNPIDPKEIRSDSPYPL